MKMFIAIILLWALSFPTFATDLPSRIDISYAVKTGIGNGKLTETMKIEQDNGTNQYHISSEARPSGITKLIKPGSILRNSWGSITKLGLQPTRFSDQRKDKQPRVAIFDWNNDVLTLQHENDEEKKPLPDGTLDRLSFSYNFMFSPPLGESINAHITDGRSLELARYAVDKETLKTPIGELETIVLTMQQENNNKLKRKIWLSTTHHMLPVRIVAIEKDGLELEKMVTKINLSYTAAHNAP
jgi:Protein of unknown function (DUF3108)